MYRKERERDSEAGDKVKFSALSTIRRVVFINKLCLKNTKEDMKDDAAGKLEQEKFKEKIKEYYRNFRGDSTDTDVKAYEKKRK